MKKYVIFYYLASAYDKVSVDAESLRDAIITADAFSANLVLLLLVYVLNYY